MDQAPGTATSLDPVTGSADDARYLQVLDRYASAGDPVMAQAVFDRMQASGTKPTRDHWQRLLSIYTGARDLAGAHLVLEGMAAAGVTPDAHAYTDLLIGYQRLGQPEAAAEVLDGMVAAGIAVPEHRAPALLSLMISLGRFGAAMPLFQQVAAAGHPISPIDANALLDDCLKRRAVKDIVSLVGTLTDAGQPPLPRLVDITRMLLAARQAERARALLQRLTDAGLDVPRDAWGLLLDGLAKAGDGRAAEEVASRAGADGDGMTAYHRNALIEAALRDSKLAEAWDLAEALFEGGSVPSHAVVEQLADQSLEAGNVARALGAVDWASMLGMSLAVETVGRLIAALVSANNVVAARQVLIEAIRSGAAIERRTARSVVEASVRSGHLAAARELLDALTTSKIFAKASEWGSLIVSLSKAGKIDEAIGVIDHLIERKMTPSGAYVTPIVDSLLARRRADDALGLIDRLTEVGVTLGEPEYRELLWVFARQGKTDLVGHVFHRMVAAGIEPDERHTKAVQWASGETKRRRDNAPPK